MIMQKVQKLEDIGKLPDNWNGYGARKFSPSLINKCQETAKSLPVEMTIYPTRKTEYPIPIRQKRKLSGTGSIRRPYILPVHV